MLQRALLLLRHRVEEAVENEIGEPVRGSLRRVHVFGDPHAQFVLRAQLNLSCGKAARCLRSRNNMDRVCTCMLHEGGLVDALEPQSWSSGSVV